MKLLARSSTAGAAALTIVALAPWLVAAAFYLAHRSITIEADSASYLDWAPDRSSGYPLFLKLAGGRFLLPIQLALFAAAASWLALRVGRISRDLILTALLTVAVIANPYVWQLQASIMSEALTTPLLVLLVGLIPSHMVGPRRSTALAMALIAGVLAATRPSNLALLPIPPLAVLIRRGGSARSKHRDAALCLAMSLAVLAADQACTRAVHGPATTSLLGRHTFAKSVLVDAPPLPPAGLSPVERSLATSAERDFAPVRRVLKSVADRPHIFDTLQGNYEVCLQYACTDRLLSGVNMPRAELDRALFRVGAERLRENPGAYLALSVKEYRGLWLLNPRKDPRLAREFNAYRATSGALPFEQQLGPAVAPVSRDETSRAGAVLRSLFIFLAIVAAVLTVALTAIQLAGPFRPYIASAWLCLLGTEAVLIFCALVGIGTPRYTMGMWPMLAGSFAFLMVFVLEALYGLIRPPARHPGVERSPACS